MGTKYLTERQASEEYSYSRAWFQRKRRDGGGPEYRKIGSRVLYPADKLSEWFESHPLIRSASENRPMGESQ